MPRTAKKRPKVNKEPQVYKALAHPLRMKLLIAMSEREASPSELAAELNEPLGNVAYHVRMLERLECIELVRTTPRRGALEHHYRAIARPQLEDADWERVPDVARRSISWGRISEIWTDLTASLASGQFDARTDRHLGWTNLSLDDQGWEQLNDELRSLYDRALEIQAESAARLHDSGTEAPVTSKLVLMHYEAASAEDGVGA
jgi:DNA-binding transcriptional ArsR family regulator